MAKSVERILAGDWPISQIFGVNPARYAQFGMAGHNGLDFAAPSGTTVLAGVNGEVIFVGDDPQGYGRNVRIFDSSQNLLLIFAHLNSVSGGIVSGFRTIPGSVIGATGNTGNTTGPHLHFAAADTDIAGMKINRENGFDGWKDPLDMNFLNLNYPKTFLTGAAPITTTTQPAYAGPTPPDYAPTFAGQTVSWLGNNFRSDDGRTWIFQGSDAERAVAGELEKKRQLAVAEAAAADAGVYLQKSNILEKFTLEGIQNNTMGVGDAENLIIKGPYEARYRGYGLLETPWSQWYTEPGTYAVTQRSDTVEIKKKPLPPPPEPLPEVAVPPPVTTTEPATTTEPPPSPSPTQPPVLPPGLLGEWTKKKAPTHKDLYNLIVGVEGEWTEKKQPTHRIIYNLIVLLHTIS